MRLFDFPRAPNPRRTRMYVAEKGIEIEKVPVNLYRLEQLSPEFLAINPGGTLPVLETDDGTFLAEAIAICTYLEALYPEPPLFGTNDLERATVLMWDNIIENEGMSSVAETLRNWSPGFRDRALPGLVDLEQIPALIERGRKRCAGFFDRVEARLSECKYIAGDQFTFADISLLSTAEFAGWVEIDPTAGRTHLANWYGEVSTRPSARA